MARSNPILEVQIHAPDIKSGVRYFFLGRWQLAALVLVVAGALALLGWALSTGPQVARDLASRHDYDVLTEVRIQQGERLRSLLGRMEELGEQSEELGRRMEKIYLAYGLSHDGSIGQGGFPFEPEPPPRSIYSTTIARGGRLRAQISEQMRVMEAFLTEIQAFEESNLEQSHTTPSVSPLRGYDYVLTSPFGTRRNPFTKGVDFHAGVDLAAPTGSPIYAPGEGVVVFAGRYDLRRSVAWWRYGNLVVLRHGDRFITLYGHCDEVRVKRGQKVQQGDVIATVGNTGWSTNPHLHYEVRRLTEDATYRPVDPRIYMLDRRWRDEERLLVRARSTPDPNDYEPLPRRFSR